MQKPHKIPFDWQRALVAYSFAIGISIYTNALLWGHLDRIQHPNATWLKLGLLFVIDLTAFVLVTWHLFAKAGFTRGYCFVAAALQLILMLVHAGAVAKYDASTNEGKASMETLAAGQAQIAEAGARGAMQGAGDAATKANSLGQRKTARRLTAEGSKAAQGATADAQKAITEQSAKVQPTTFLPKAYLDGAMYYALMVISGILLFGALAATDWHRDAEDLNQNGIPDWMEGYHQSRVPPGFTAPAPPPAPQVAQNPPPDFQQRNPSQSRSWLRRLFNR